MPKASVIAHRRGDSGNTCTTGKQTDSLVCVLLEIIHQRAIHTERRLRSSGRIRLGFLEDWRAGAQGIKIPQEGG
jgi:hypothetical protein